MGTPFGVTECLKPCMSKHTCEPRAISLRFLFLQESESKYFCALESIPRSQRLFFFSSSFLYFACSPPFECERSGKTLWIPLFSPTRIYRGIYRRPTVQSPLAGGCMTMTFCPLRPRIQRIYCPTHADLSLPPS